MQLVGYEVQYQMFQHFDSVHHTDNMDHAGANVGAAVVATVFACVLSFLVDMIRDYYYAKILLRDHHLDHGKTSAVGTCVFAVVSSATKLGDLLRIGRKSDALKLQLQKKLKEQKEEMRRTGVTDIVLTEEEEALYVETVVGSGPINIWALLMPTVYQLVPGSMIAKLWFNALFPPKVEAEGSTANMTFLDPDYAENSNVFSNLLVISTSLAIGLLLGLALVQAGATVVCWLVYSPWAWNAAEATQGDGADADAADAGAKPEAAARRKQRRTMALDRLQGMFTAADDNHADAADDEVERLQARKKRETERKFASMFDPPADYDSDAESTASGVAGETRPEPARSNLSVGFRRGDSNGSVHSHLSQRSIAFPQHKPTSPLKSSMKARARDQSLCLGSTAEGDEGVQQPPFVVVSSSPSIEDTVAAERVSEPALRTTSVV